MSEASEGHLWRGNLYCALGADLLAVLTKSASLFRHDWFPTLLLSKGLFAEDCSWLGDWDFRHTHALGLDDA